MRIERLGDLGSAPRVLRAIAAAAQRRGVAPPAALIGEWFGSGAVIAPSLAVSSPSAISARWVVAERDQARRNRDDGVVGGGWFGYLSYPDAGADGRPPRIPEAAGGWTDCVLRQDSDGHWSYESLSGAPLAGWVEEALRKPMPAVDFDITWKTRTATRTAGVCSPAWRRSPRARSTRRACARSSRARSTARRSISSSTRSERTSPARAAFLAGEWGAVASLSPELFLRRVGDAVTSSPIKGTLPRSADPAALRASVKDVAENIMIVDLVRNDLSRVAVTGSVTVPELLAVRPAPGVWHLVSTVSARVPVDVPMAALLDAAFPPASVTGTPKTRARQLLAGWESLGAESIAAQSVWYRRLRDAS